MIVHHLILKPASSISFTILHLELVVCVLCVLCDWGVLGRVYMIQAALILPLAHLLLTFPALLLPGYLSVLAVFLLRAFGYLPPAGCFLPLIFGHVSLGAYSPLPNHNLLQTPFLCSSPLITTQVGWPPGVLIPSPYPSLLLRTHFTPSTSRVRVHLRKLWPVHISISSPIFKSLSPSHLSYRCSTYTCGIPPPPLNTSLSLRF